MPTVPRRPAAQRERDRLQARRLRAAELFAAGVRQAEVARRLGVTAQAMSIWPGLVHRQHRLARVRATGRRSADGFGRCLVGDRAAFASGADGC
jgi:hypothetical protein